MVEITCLYYIEGRGDADDAYELVNANPADGKEFDETDIETLARIAAEDFHDEQGGSVLSWPLTFVIVDDAGRELGRAEVEREQTPVFSARAITREEPVS